jgi:hypothetical protein
MATWRRHIPLGLDWGGGYLVMWRCSRAKAVDCAALIAGKDLLAAFGSQLAYHR